MPLIQPKHKAPQKPQETAEAPSLAVAYSVQRQARKKASGGFTLPSEDSPVRSYASIADEIIQKRKKLSAKPTEADEDTTDDLDLDLFYDDLDSTPDAPEAAPAGSVADRILAKRKAAL